MSERTDPAFSEIRRSFMDRTVRTTRDEAGWLHGHGMLADPGQPFSVETTQDWYQPGGESYLLQFQIQQQEVLSRFIMKACVIPPGTHTVSEWNKRRALLSQHGIQTPTLHAVDRATYIEEFIDHSLKDVYATADEQARDDLHDQFTNIHLTTRELGFKPVSFHDVRSRGDDVVVIDFGSDLGGIFPDGTPLPEESVRRIADADFARFTRK